MAQPLDGSFERIREYAVESHDLHDGQIDLDPSDTEARFRPTLQQLQARVEQQEAALGEVGQSSENTSYC